MKPGRFQIRNSVLPPLRSNELWDGAWIETQPKEPNLAYTKLKTAKRNDTIMAANVILSPKKLGRLDASISLVSRFTSLSNSRNQDHIIKHPKVTPNEATAIRIGNKRLVDIGISLLKM